MRQEITDYYNSGVESTRLSQDVSQLEKARTQEIIQRYLKDQPLKIADIGGGAGVYSFWLKESGYEIHLVDATASNIEVAKQRAGTVQAQPDGYHVAEASNLPFGDEYFDIVLFLGPLYHLVEREERLQALREAS